MSLKTLLKANRSMVKSLNHAKIRNLSALTPLLKKGGIHDKDNPKTKHRRDRKSSKLALKRQIYDVI